VLGEDIQNNGATAVLVKLELSPKLESPVLLTSIITP
jgi:hypothetical protein